MSTLLLSWLFFPSDSVNEAFEEMEQPRKGCREKGRGQGKAWRTPIRDLVAGEHGVGRRVTPLPEAGLFLSDSTLSLQPQNKGSQPHHRRHLECVFILVVLD